MKHMGYSHKGMSYDGQRITRGNAKAPSGKQSPLNRMNNSVSVNQAQSGATRNTSTQSKGQRKGYHAIEPCAGSY